LIVPCEVATKSVIPALRALIAEQLRDQLSLKQDDIARVLGISQSAISKYNRKVRGKAINVRDLEDVRSQINRIVRLVADGTCDRKMFLKLFCEMCTRVRRSGLMCPLCRKTDETLKIGKCSACLSLA
jgi:predicted transcriptional regulator